MPAELNKDGFLTYKGRPLVRCKDTIYYGDMHDEQVVMLQIVEKKKYNDLELASKIKLQMLLTDPGVDITQRIVKKSEKGDLYDALDVADIWLTRAESK